VEIEVRGGNALQDWNLTNWRKIETSCSCGAVVVLDSSQWKEATAGRGRERERVAGGGGRLENEGYCWRTRVTERLRK